LQRPTDDVIGPILFRDLIFPCADTPAHRCARFMHAVAAPGFQMVPCGQVLALMNKAIGAARRQPSQRRDELRCQLQAIRDTRRPVGIIAACAALAIEQAASNIGRQDLAIIRVFEFDEAAAATAIAETFPLGIVEFGERFLAPERRGGFFGHGALAGKARTLGRHGALRQSGATASTRLFRIRSRLRFDRPLIANAREQQDPGCIGQWRSMRAPLTLRAPRRKTDDFTHDASVRLVRCPR